MRKAVFLLLVLIALIQCKPSASESRDLSESAAVEAQPTIKNVDIKGAKLLIAQNNDLIIIDARTPEEYVEGTLPNAINVDVKNDNFESEINKLDKSAKYLVHCRSGSRSLKAADIMIKNGFVNVTNMEGGYLAWMDSEKEE